MSRFKFRAWHHYEGMTDDIVIGRKGFTANWKGQGGLRVSQEFGAPEEVIIMQSTGLLDKNGKEIFERDIIEYLVGHGGRQKVICEVAWSDFKHGWLPFSDDAYRINNGEVSCVLGNIFENAEYLTRGGIE
jgi:hypothetical protein